MSETITRKNWLITGVSSGIGRSRAEAALGEGHVVVGTVRKPEQRGMMMYGEEGLAPPAS